MWISFLRFTRSTAHCEFHRIRTLLHQNSIKGVVVTLMWGWQSSMAYSSILVAHSPILTHRWSIGRRPIVTAESRERRQRQALDLTASAY